MAVDTLNAVLVLGVLMLLVVGFSRAVELGWL
jgi:hypothetical protein